MPVLDFKMPPLGEANRGHRPPLEPKSVKYPAGETGYTMCFKKRFMFEDIRLPVNKNYGNKQ